MNSEDILFVSYLNKAFQNKKDILDGAEIQEFFGFVFVRKELVRPPDGKDYYVGHRIKAVDEVNRVYREEADPDESVPLIDRFGPITASFSSYLPILIPFVNDSAVDFPLNPSLYTAFKMKGRKYNEISYVIVNSKKEHHLIEALSKNLLQLAYAYNQRYQPAYAWLDISPSISGLAYGPILKHKFRELYWVNFFGPEYVTKYGKEFFLSAPVWKTEELADGGVLLQLSPELTDTNFEIDVQAIAQHFFPVGVRFLTWPKVIRFTEYGPIAQEKEVPDF